MGDRQDRVLQSAPALTHILIGFFANEKHSSAEICRRHGPRARESGETPICERSSDRAGPPDDRTRCHGLRDARDRFITFIVSISNRTLYIYIMGVRRIVSIRRVRRRGSKGAG